jgi:protoporphyrinogen oxidase
MRRWRIALKREGNRVGSVVIKSSDTDFEEVDGTDFVSTMPITDLVLSMDPPAPPEVLDAAKSLSYRSILTVNLLIDQQDMFPDTWIYVHSPEVRVGRIQCYKNWSPYMVPDQSKSSLGLEYFATEGDDLWIMNDADLIALAKQEITSLGLCREDRIIDGFVVRMAKAYPVYDAAYTQRFGYIKQWVASIENLQPSGRYGLFRYNNSDHSILSAMYAVRTLLGEKGFDVWQVNTEDDYHEEHSNH